MALTLPRIMVLSKDSIGCVRYVDESQVRWDSEGSVFDPLAKIVIEKPENDNTPKNVVHLRFGYSNRYWARGNGDWIVGSKDPKEDKSNPACTLFYLAPFPSTQGPWFSIQHLQSGGYVNIYNSSSRIYVDPNDSKMTATQWLYTDWETLVKIPAHVAFKGDNGKYLTAAYQQNLPYLQFSSDDPNEARSGFQVQFHPRGYLRINSDHFNKFWQLSFNKDGANWIWADSDETSGDSNDTLFWPVRLDDSTIALRNKANDNFCKPVTKEGKTDCLIADVKTITKEARLGVLELAQDRKVYNVKYQMEYARIHDQKPYLAGKTTAINKGDKEAQIGVTVTYEDHRSHSFRRSSSITAGVSVSIEADVLGIVKGRVESSFSVTGGFEWGDTTTTTNKVQATGSVTVPAKSMAVVSYVGTQGTCDVPFHYSQEYTSTTDGRIHRKDEVDGIFTGINCYDFNFQFGEIQSLSRL